MAEYCENCQRMEARISGLLAAAKLYADDGMDGDLLSIVAETLYEQADGDERAGWRSSANCLRALADKVSEKQQSLAKALADDLAGLPERRTK